MGKISRKIRKIAGKDAERPSRLHTRRGDFAPFSQLLLIPKHLIERFRPEHSGPWMAAGAVKTLNGLLSPDLSLLELGSGSSTKWYGERAGSVVSLEPVSDWALKTRSVTSHLSNVDVRFGPVTETAPSLLSQGGFDVVIVDHDDEPSFSRCDALRCVGATVKFVVLDDSDRREYSDADTIMAGWRRERFVSYRHRPLAPTETTVYSR